MQRVTRYLHAAGMALCLAYPCSTVADVFSELENDIQRQNDTSDHERQFREFQHSNSADFEDYKATIAAEFEAFKKITEQEVNAFKQRLNEVWDDNEVSSPTVWVEYSQDLSVKKRIDFDKQQISLSAIDHQNTATLRKTVKSLVIKNKAQAFRDDQLSQAIERRSVRQISTLKTDRVEPAPVLIPYLTGRNRTTDKEVERIVDHMLANKKTQQTTNKRGKKIITVTMPLQAPASVVKTPPASAKRWRPVKTSATELPKAALALRAPVDKYAQQSSIDPAVIFAVIETESSFNPMARSGVPAYGLMQIVPGSAGQDATAQLFGKARILSPSYLYNRDNNIEIGSTYLNILYYRYLKKITNPTSRLYCVIAAYNTGSGNVAKAFTGRGRVSEAVSKINRLSPQQVYSHLIKHLPYEETRNYLKKVNKRIGKYDQV